MEIKKSVEDSLMEMVQLVLPDNVNLLNNLKGGQLMHWIDIVAALTASKHAGCAVATASMESLDFKHAIPLGNMVKLRAKLISVGNTSMNIKVDVWREDLKSGATLKTNEAHLVFVALNEEGRPTRVPRLV